MKTEIIADIGINFMGDMNIARKMIADVAECGASICKFQWYSVFDLFGDPSKDTYNDEIYQNVQSFELSEEKIKQLIKWCEYEGVEFGCSVFDTKRFEIIDGLGVKHHKVASRVSKYDRPLAIKMLETGKPTYVSLGFGAEQFSKETYKNYFPLYCVAKYPSEYSDFNFPANFKDSEFYGFSSHAMTPYPAMVAISRGAKCIEVHYTLDKSMAALRGGYDHICSLNKTELKQLCEFAKHAERLDL